MTNVTRTDLQALSPTQKAAMIYAQARSELSDRLWHAALGDGDAPAKDKRQASDGDGMALDSLLALFEPRRTDAAAAPHPAASPQTDTPDDQAPDDGDGDRPAPAAGLGSNARYAGVLASAAARTGIPAPALAAIVDAEAAKGSDGGWITYSRNPRSSAAGLGQFLSGTWEGMAQAKGSWLNGVAQAKGWLDGAGRVSAAARSELLQMRYDAEAAINTVADYARTNLDGLARAGVPIGHDATTIAQSAYLGHHLGLGDAIRFAKGGLDPDRARMLLRAQVGAARASHDIAAAGDAATAHRAWLMDYVNRHLQPGRFGV